MSHLVRPNIRGMMGYVPGEQPRDGSFIKLNTNENPYPPAPGVVEAIQAVLAGDRLRKYPDPVGTELRRTAGQVLGLDPDSILIGNGSDDILTMVTRAVVPEGGLVTSPSPSYILYATLAAIQNARFGSIPFTADWQLPDPWPASGAQLTFLANPNSPSGTVIRGPALERLCEQLDGLLVLDEAYVDFADDNGLNLASRPNVLVTRSLSKSYSLAGIRFGYAVGRPDLIHELLKVKDSYNCDVLSLAAATAALQDQDYLRQTRNKIRATRARLTSSLGDLGFEVCPSQANFVWARRADRPVRPLYEELRRRRILVRYMFYDGYGDGLRVSVGTDADSDRLIEELRRLL
jgi:histidinol-phosphate aminotransferase